MLSLDFRLQSFNMLPLRPFPALKKNQLWWAVSVNCLIKYPPVKWSVPYVGFSTSGLAPVAISAPCSFYFFLNWRNNTPAFVSGADNVELLLQISKSNFCDFSRRKTENNIGEQSSKHIHKTTSILGTVGFKQLTSVKP